jgi:hypothetical protein
MRSHVNAWFAGMNQARSVLLVWLQIAHMPSPRMLRYDLRNTHRSIVRRARREEAMCRVESKVWSQATHALEAICTWICAALCFARV